MCLLWLQVNTSIAVFVFFRFDVCDRNTESPRPEGEPDGVLCHHSTDWLLQWHPEHPSVGPWAFQGQRAQTRPVVYVNEPFASSKGYTVTTSFNVPLDFVVISDVQ